MLRQTVCERPAAASRLTAGPDLEHLKRTSTFLPASRMAYLYHQASAVGLSHARRPSWSQCTRPRTLFCAAGLQEFRQTDHLPRLLAQASPHRHRPHGKLCLTKADRPLPSSRVRRVLVVAAFCQPCSSSMSNHSPITLHKPRWSRRDQIRQNLPRAMTLHKRANSRLPMYTRLLLG